MKSKYINGKRSFQLVPAIIIAGPIANHGYEPVSKVEALMAVQWICRQLLAWKHKRSANIYDMLYTGGGINHRDFPDIVPDCENNLWQPHDPCQLLRYLIAKLANRKYCDWLRFARQMLGYRDLHTPITVRFRKPPMELPGWLAHFHGVRLKKSANKYHTKAYWLHGGYFRLTEDARRWKFNIEYSYRHEGSSWAIGIEQKRGEKFEAFIARIWAWIEPQIKWRHEESWYSRFYCGVDGMKQNELRTCSEPELRMWRLKSNLKSVFAWGTAPPDWEEQIAEGLLVDADPQYRDVLHIPMSPARLATIKRWIADDRRKKK